MVGSWLADYTGIRHLNMTVTGRGTCLIPGQWTWKRGKNTGLQQTQSWWLGKKDKNEVVRIQLFCHGTDLKASPGRALERNGMWLFFSQGGSEAGYQFSHCRSPGAPWHMSVSYQRPGRGQSQPCQWQWMPAAVASYHSRWIVSFCSISAQNLISFSYNFFLILDFIWGLCLTQIPIKKCHKKTTKTWA